MRSTSTTGPRWARRGGPTARCCPTSSGRRPFAGGGDDYRGDRGPLRTRLGTLDCPLYAAFIEAGAQAGYLRTPDSNGYRQEGFGPQSATVGDGRRWSTRARLPGPGAGPGQSRGGDRCPGASGADKRKPGRRRRLRARGQPLRSPRPARGDRVRGHHELAASPHAVGTGTGAAAAGPRYRRGQGTCRASGAT